MGSTDFLGGLAFFLLSFFVVVFCFCCLFLFIGFVFVVVCLFVFIVIFTSRVIKLNAPKMVNRTSHFETGFVYTKD